jgi:hypothetical protein
MTASTRTKPTIEEAVGWAAQTASPMRSRRAPLKCTKEDRKASIHAGVK